MRVILVIERKYLFPGLSPHGFLAPEAVDLDALAGRMFFAERDFMEANSHYKQIIPYQVLRRGTGTTARVLAYQRRAEHTEQRLGSLWSVGFGGHIEPLDRTDPQVAALGLVQAAALRELGEETGLLVDGGALQRVGYINSDQEAVSSVHFGVVYLVDLDDHPGSDAQILATISAQTEPHQARWLPAAELRSLLAPGTGPDGGTFEDWSRIVVGGVFGPDHS